MRDKQSMEQQLLQQLSDTQREAVVYTDGPQLVIAGAGSGKTRVLTYKIAYLLQQGMRPWNILALTFTNKAANGMKERIGQLVDEESARMLQMGTFHSVFARILRVESQVLGYSPQFTIYDESDSRSLIKSILKTMGLDDKTYKPSTVHGRISMAKNYLTLPDQYSADQDLISRDRHQRLPEIHKIYHAYQQRLKQANAMDFDDLLVQTYLLFRQHEDIRQKYAARFQYVLVDEYQDTNYVQQQIVWLLTKENQRVCVVGDDYQSIYAFRGANIKNILDFQQIYPDSRLFKLEQNYRSTQLIVGAANSLMKHNERQIPKDVYSKNEVGNKVIVKETLSDRREAATVCQEIQQLRRKDHAEYSDFAILYRTNAQSRNFEEEMRKPEVNIPYRIYGGLSFYQRKEIKDVIAYFRLVANPDDEEAFRRIINYPARGIGNTTVEKLMQTAARERVSLWEVIANPQDHRLDVNKGTSAKLASFEQLISGYRLDAQKMDAYTLAQHVIKSSGIYADIAVDRTPEGIARLENLEELLNGVSDFVESQKEQDLGQQIFVTDYLQQVSLMTDLDSDDNSESRVSLMTIHSAKGLEFKYVFIVGLEENIFPSPMSSASLAELEEERRLLYVAITRAEKYCCLTWAHCRYRFGKMDAFINPSRFLNEIDPQFLLIDGEKHTDDFGVMNFNSKPSFRQRDYESNRPYTGTREWGEGFPKMASRMQNSRPVAGQFMADPKPKITTPRQPERAVDPLSESFKQRLLQSGGRLKKIEQAMANGGRTAPEFRQAGNPSQPSLESLSVGTKIEHQRFGVGTVTRIEGTGENTKATVDFELTGTKQLLLKFARFKIVN